MAEKGITSIEGLSDIIDAITEHGIWGSLRSRQDVPQPTPISEAIGRLGVVNAAVANLDYSRRTFEGYEDYLSFGGRYESGIFSRSLAKSTLTNLVITRAKVRLKELGLENLNPDMKIQSGSGIIHLVPWKKLFGLCLRAYN